jgi:glutamyl-Q tRNA(Asp) synthetase
MPTYRGRFAPSPTGPLHFGSLFAAVISYLEARNNGGEWLVRIEDIDPLREQQGVSKEIIKTLSCHGLFSDAPIIYQKNHTSLYQQTLAQLQTNNFAYACPCSRKYLLEHNGEHKPDCVNKQVDATNCAIKFRSSSSQKLHGQFIWDDKFQGTQTRTLTDDFVLKRKEGFFAYQLAVVCDDIEQEISHVVRGYDLLESSPMQLALYLALNKTPPQFAHFPVIVFKNGQKLSKQNKAPAINNNLALDNLLSIFSILGLKLKYKPDNCNNALNEALENWNPTFLFGKSELMP